ncbi:MAG: hypothetical protein K2Q10_11750 [Rhodospirillales bacterium]|nr:hypothetical protein [Rhodospirillales bacterium]
MAVFANEWHSLAGVLPDELAASLLIHGRSLVWRARWYDQSLLRRRDECDFFIALRKNTLLTFPLVSLKLLLSQTPVPKMLSKDRRLHNLHSQAVYIGG